MARRRPQLWTWRCAEPHPCARASDLRRAPASARIHVTVPTYAGRRQRPGVRIHRSLTLRPEDVTTHRGIAVTTVARTIADLRRKVAPHVIRDVVRKAEIQQLDLGPLPHVQTDHPDRSELERRFLAVLRRHGVAAPALQQIIGAYTVDFLWPNRRLIVEVDGWGTTGPGLHSRMTVPATPGSRRRAIGSCASPGSRSLARARGWPGPCSNCFAPSARAPSARRGRGGRGPPRRNPSPARARARAGRRGGRPTSSPETGRRP